MKNEKKKLKNTNKIENSVSKVFFSWLVTSRKIKQNLNRPKYSFHIKKQTS